jgi:hypothetical protein
MLKGVDKEAQRKETGPLTKALLSIVVHHGLVWIYRSSGQSLLWGQPVIIVGAVQASPDKVTKSIHKKDAVPPAKELMPAPGQCNAL